MSDIFKDTFAGSNGTLLSAHTADYGGGYGLIFGGDHIIDGHNRIRNNSAAAGLQDLTVVPAGADYSIEANFSVLDNANDEIFIIGVRGDGTTGDRYEAIFDSSANDNDGALYMCAFGPTFEVVGAITTWLPTIGTLYNIKLTVSGNVMSLYRDGTLLATGTPAGTVTATGKAFISLTGVADDTHGCRLSGLRVYPTGSPSAALAVGTLSVTGHTSTTATVTSSGGSGGIPGYTTQIYRSLTTGFTPGGGNLVSGATSLTLNDSGLTSGTTVFYRMIVTDASGAKVTSNEASVTLASAVAIAPNDSHIYYDPVGWSVSLSRALSVNAGSYLRIKFTGSTYIRAYLDISQYPDWATEFISYRIDDGAWIDVTLSPSTTFIDFATGLATTAHTLYVVMVAFNQFDSWSSNPVDSFRITGFELSGGGSVQTLTDIKSKRAISFGDSITRQTHAGAAGADDARCTYPPAMWGAMDAEYSSVSFGSQGWTVAFDIGGVPFFTPGNDAASSWNKYYTGAARTFTSIDYVSVFMGTNDSGATDSAVQLCVTGWLTAIRAACPSAKIFVFSPFYAKVSAVATGFNNYQTATPDGSAFLIDLGASGAAGITTYPTASWASVDGLHPNTTKHAQLAASWAARMKAALGGNPSVIYG